MVFIRMNIPRRGYFFTRLYKNYIYLVLPYGEFSSGNSHNLLANPLYDRVYELKETQKGVEFMCREMEQIYSEGIESGELKKAKASALSMAADGMKVDKIAHYLNVSVQMVQKWIDESMSVAH